MRLKSNTDKSKKFGMGEWKKGLKIRSKIKIKFLKKIRKRKIW
jgi:hypothetical protein